MYGRCSDDRSAKRGETLANTWRRFLSPPTGKYSDEYKNVFNFAEEGRVGCREALIVISPCHLGSTQFSRLWLVSSCARALLLTSSLSRTACCHVWCWRSLLRLLLLSLRLNTFRDNVLHMDAGSELSHSLLRASNNIRSDRLLVGSAYTKKRAHALFLSLSLSLPPLLRALAHKLTCNSRLGTRVTHAGECCLCIS